MANSATWQPCLTHPEVDARVCPCGSSGAGPVADYKLDRQARIIQTARVVADHWRAASMEWGDGLMLGRLAAHPLCMVLSALDGVMDPTELGIEPGPDADRIFSTWRP